MPYSSTPVYVGKGDTVQVRYPTPATWNTQVTVNLKIGTGTDPDGITFGTKIPDSKPNDFAFTAQQGYTTAGSATAATTGTFQRATTYYSNIITIDGIEVPIPAEITQVKSNGPKNNNTNNTTAQFRYKRNGAFSSWMTSISVNYSNGTGGLRPGDEVQLRVTTEDWYVTNTQVSFKVSDEVWGTDLGQPSTSFTRVWSITTRAQDQDITPWEFTDIIDAPIPADGGDPYYYKEVSIVGLDDDVVLRASATGNTRISVDNVNWSTSIGAQLVKNDILYTRIQTGTSYTDRNNGTVRVYATGGDTYTRGTKSYENTTAGTYGSGSAQVTQTLGDVSDSWYLWTEVDRYPDPISAAPLYTISCGYSINSVGNGFTRGDVYSVTGGSGTGMTVKQGVPTGLPIDANSFTSVQVVDPGYGYVVGDVLTIPSPSGNATLNASVTLVEYQTVTVSQTNVNNFCEPDFYYFANFNVSGLGTEYASGQYSPLTSPYTGLVNTVANLNSINNLLNGAAVEMTADVSGTGRIRKNNTGSWVQQLIVKSGDVINFKNFASSSFNTTKNSTVTLQGPPDASPTGNPTGGPSVPTIAEKTALMTLKTRNARTTPAPFKAENVYLANPGQQYEVSVAITGLDANTTASIVASGTTTGSGAQIQTDGTNWYGVGANVTLVNQTYGSSKVQYIKLRANASANSGGVVNVNYKIGNTTASWKIYTYQYAAGNSSEPFESTTFPGGSVQEYILPDYAASEFYVTLVGAGGGAGGDDYPNSFGGVGGSGNLVRAKISIPESYWPVDPIFGPQRKIKVYVGAAGESGESLVSNAGGGAGGFGFAYGGDGGNSGSGDLSGGGGGGGGATAITTADNTLIVMAGGGAGGAGAGNDTTIPSASANGNNSGNGSFSTDINGISQTGNNGASDTGEGGGAGGGGGGYGTGGTIPSSKLDENGNVIQTDDLDATGGSGGGAYYKSEWVTLLDGTTSINNGAPSGEDGVTYIEYAPQDITPQPFFFDTTDPATPLVETYSSKAFITGITGTVNIQLNAPGFVSAARVCTGTSDSTCGAWGAASIGNNQYLQLRATPGAQYNTTYTVAATVGDSIGEWDINTGEPPDTYPDPFNFPDITKALINTVYTSDEIFISGINTAVPISASNGAEISVNQGAFVAGNTSGLTVQNGQGVRIRLTSSSNYEASVETTVSIGNPSRTNVWSITTDVERDSVPNPLPSWIFVTGAGLLTEYQSNTFLVQNIDTAIKFVVESGPGDNPDTTGGLPIIILNDVEQYESDNVTPKTEVDVVNFDQIRLKYVTTDITGDTRVFNTKIGLEQSTDGYYETEWGVQTSGTFGTDPTKFTFSSVLAKAPDVFTESTETITISGLATGVSINVFGTNGLQILKNNTGGYNSYTIGSPLSVSNGDTIRVRLKSSAIPGLSRSASLYAGSYVTGFTVQTPASVKDPILGQWYSAIQPVKYLLDNNGNVDFTKQIRLSEKFDGLPVGSMMPVFQDATEDDNWGVLDGKLNSRFHGFVLCDGSYYPTTDYPALYGVIGFKYGSKQVGSIGFTATVSDNSTIITSVSSIGSLKLGMVVVINTSGITIPVNTTIVSIDSDAGTVELSADVSGSASSVSFTASEIYFRVPDMRNKYVKGTGVIDGNQASSPGLTPTLRATKQSGAPGNEEPGAMGGMWFIDTIADPGVEELEQVETPATGQPAQDSVYFGVAQLTTTGYTDVQSQVEFITQGSSIAKIGIKKAKIYDTPLHFHELVAGQADPGNFKGRIGWGQIGGYAGQFAIGSTNQNGNTSSSNFRIDDSFFLNQWGYALANYTLNADNLPESQYCPDAGYGWIQSDTVSPNGGNWECDVDPGFEGVRPDGVNFYTNITIVQDALSGAAATEIGSYIDLSKPTNANAGNNVQFIGAIDIPRKDATIKGWSPLQKLSHNHFISLTQYDSTQYGYGNDETGGSFATSGLTEQNTSVDLEFSFLDTGITVLPGTFTLGQSKQLVPTPEFSPQEKVPLVTPYTWVKWLIKTF